mmetsp:Transcript_19727/g.40240  ORF Transcript_19727/g.40240 Transcript_19727/m.40240 type:complete len:414 (-) Transcript_19727:359-1600(-)|eukprot:CAMPEP_0181307718 /NCGR_PEP_ID=MMETSP1101-20121128/11045_1 /TAXON_ID=46948 /ORGANISM="Rhodomonas abbreviata, Strain Caron Lab Isolate" /LENGTH=413 /DNA_ID=CAMNT_0023413985 /DNA_START=249 /DNA_END=1490 /DNA_ORIENTATION=-
MKQTTSNNRTTAWAVTAAFAAAVVCLVVAIITVTTGHTGRVSLEENRLAPSNRLVNKYPSAMKSLASAAVTEISSFHRRKLTPQAKHVVPPRRRSSKLTSDPDVASYMFSNENGNWDANFGPDNGYIPYEKEPCTDGVCYTNYGMARGGARGLSPHKSARTPRASLLQLTRAFERKLAAQHRGGSSAAWLQQQQQRVHSATKGRLQGLEEVSDFPDIGYDDEVKEARKQISDLYDPLEPLSEQGEQSSAEKEDYADFYRAYAAYQLPHEVSNRGGPGPWVAENDRIGGNDLPPHAYPYSEAYYPPGTPKASLTINANGEGSSNVFHVQGPNMINVNIGSMGAAADEQGGYTYPDGKTAVPSPSKPSVRREVSGRPILTGGTEGKEEGFDPSETPCDQDPQCSFWQDAYDDAYW